MKLNEALLIGGALLAALVISKGGAVSSIFKKSSVPFMPLENKTISFIENLPQLETFKQFFPVKETNVQLKNIMNIEKKENIQRVSYLQNELDQTQKYISDQYKIANPVYSRGQNPAFVYTDDIQNILNLRSSYGKVTDENLIQYYENYSKTQPLNFREKMYNILIAKRNISKAEIYQEKQEAGINLINEEYQTRFGGLSRYG
jgi:hypothetical protein